MSNLTVHSNGPDCSTTFQNQDYKSHTSCISEAEKYQGALYKGKKSATATPAASTPAASTPADSPAPDIHPSRQGMVAAGEDTSFGYGGYGGRGRGGSQRGGRGRGGFGGRGGFQQAERTPKFSLTGENRQTPEGGMRAWGSAPTSDAEGAGEEKKRRKGDKGGTGAKANSRLKEEAKAEEAAGHQDKKRKREESEAVSAPVVPAGPPSDKTLKRIRKHMSKLEKKEEVPLAQWLVEVGKGKEKTVDQSEVLAGLKVAFVDGRWQLSV